MIAEIADAKIHDPVCFAGIHLIRPDAVRQVIEYIAQEQSFEHAHAEVDGIVQSRSFRLLPDAVIHLKSNDPESVKPCVLQREAILGRIRAEPAGSAGACGEIQIVVDDVLPRHASGFEVAQVLDQSP